MAMSKHILDVLLGSRARPKILKFIFHTVEKSFSVREIAEHTQEPFAVVKKELVGFAEIKLVKKADVQHRDIRYTLDPRFEFFHELRDLILKSSPTQKGRMIERINQLGRV